MNWEKGYVEMSSPTTRPKTNESSAPSLYKKVDDVTFQRWKGAGTVKELEYNGDKYNYYYHNGKWNVTNFHVVTDIIYHQGGTLKNTFYGTDENEYTEGCSDGINWIKKNTPTDSLVVEW